MAIKYSTSKKLIKNAQVFLNIKYYSYFHRFFSQESTYYGWGRKESGLKAISLATKQGTSFVLLEDGFIRSLSLGVENILNTYDFSNDKKLLDDAKKAIKLILEHNVSKYNNAPNIISEQILDDKKKVLVIAQTAGYASLKYGMLDDYTTDDIIDIAVAENPDSRVYLKIHPDVLSGKKRSDINIESAKQKCILIEENVNPIALLKNFSKVYTKTSQMGFEALLVGCECVCFGMPFYAGWGITKDKSYCERRTAQRSIEEVFAAAYILYTRYYNPYRKRPSDIFDTINEIIFQKKKRNAKESYDILALGDSHIRIFEYFNYFIHNKNIKITYVPGATARGIKNMHSKTQAYYKFLESLEECNYERIIVTLGEVDTSYTIWEHALRKEMNVEFLLQESIKNYKAFLLQALSYAPVTVISTSLPTLSDTQKCDDSITGIRKKVQIPQQKRTSLTLEFNRAIKIFSQTQEDITFIDLDPIVLSKKGIVKSLFLNKKNKCDHHYRHTPYALLLMWKLKNIFYKI